jgi:hypothetical protein
MNQSNDFDTAALAIVQEFGGTGTYTRYTVGAYNPATGKATRTTTSQTVKVAITDLQLRSNGTSLKYGTEVVAGDKEAYLIPPEKTGGTSIAPIDVVNDTLTVGPYTYTIVSYKETNPDGTTPILYSLYLRR